MKSLVELFRALLQESGRKCGVPVSRDLKTIRDRSKHEGDSFLTIALPRFCQAFEQSLDRGEVAPELFLSFGKKQSGIPEFLQGFLCRVFANSGKLLDVPSTDCIRAVRQICLFGKKVQRPCSRERTADAVEKYIQCDREVATELPDRLGRAFGLIGDLLMQDLGLTQEHDWVESFNPRHGPGATRERISGNQKWVFRRWHMRLEAAGIKYWKYAKATSWPAYTSSAPLPSFVGTRDEEPVRVVFVPKTLSSPRVIAVEPVCMQYVQQGLSRVLVSRLERARLTCGSVNFTDQSVNQHIALESSTDGGFATVDLSDASDRVGIVHVRTLFRSAPRFLEWMEACRSTHAQLPSGEVISLEKWASMGSALCFPVESIVFFASIMASIISRLGLPVSARTLSSLKGCVRVYGDDLIIPAGMAPGVVSDLEALGFKVNARKSFWTGRFRESCGVDAYDGEEVTPCYLRRDAPRDIRDVSGVLSWVATANQLSSAGYGATASLLRNAVEDVTGALPVVPRHSPAIGWFDYSMSKPLTRWNAHLQRREIRAFVATPTFVPDRFNGNEQALAKCFRLIGSQESIDKDHLRRSPRRYALALKRSWVSAY